MPVLLEMYAPAAGASSYIDWTVSVVDSGITSGYARNTLAVDANGAAHIAYLDFAAKDIKYATRDGVGWLVEVVEDSTALDSPMITAMPSLALDSQGRPHVVYAAARDGANVLVHASRNSMVWNYETIVSTNGWPCDYRLSLDENDQPHVTYSIWSGVSMDLHYRTRDVDVWSDSIIGEGDQSALVLDDAGCPVVVFRGLSGESVTHLQHAALVDGVWSVEELAYQGNWPTLALDGVGLVHLTTKMGSWVYYATNVTGTWVFTPICQSITDARNAPIEIDGFGDPVIAFTDSGHNLCWAFRYGDTWSIDFIDPEGGPTWGNTPGMAIDALGYPRVAFRGGGGLELTTGYDQMLTAVDNQPPESARALWAVPNPFNPMTRIKYDVPVDGRVTLRVYDIRGALIRTLVDADLPRGSHQATWDGRDASGRGMASGSYFARLEAGGRVETVRMSLVR